MTLARLASLLGLIRAARWWVNTRSLSGSLHLFGLARDVRILTGHPRAAADVGSCP